MEDSNLEALLGGLSNYIGIDGRVPEPLFYFISSHFGESCLELCIFHLSKENELYVFLSPRSSIDPFWPNQLHIPGVRKIVTDTEEETLHRVIIDSGLELDPKKVRYCSSRTVKNERGTEFSDLRWVEYEGENLTNFYSITSLPENIIEFQRPMIREAIECFRRNNE